MSNEVTITIASPRSNSSTSTERDERRRTEKAKPKDSRGLTFWLFLPSLVGLIGTTCCLWLGWISLGASLAILVPAYFFMAICVHDAIHRAAHRHATLNRAVGWIAASTMAIPFPAIRRIHLNHHASFGHDHDDERFIYRSAVTLPFRLLIVNWRCYGVLARLTRRERIQAGILLGCVVALFLWKPLALFWGWLLPMQIGVALFALMSVYLPHGPFGQWVMKHLPALTGFHDDHHAKPQLPWYEHFRNRHAR